MVRPSRYNISDEGAGLEGDVLKNLLGIADQAELEDTETVLLSDAYEHFFNILQSGELEYSTELLLQIHKEFLGVLYEWAGKLRSVDISKDGMLFAPVQHLAESFKQLESTILENMPSELDNVDVAAKKLAVIHNEFNAVHPFREGNGRTIRLFLDLLAVAAGYNVIDYGVSTDDYVAACVAGMKGDNSPMAELIRAGLTQK